MKTACYVIALVLMFFGGCVSALNEQRPRITKNMSLLMIGFLAGWFIHLSI